MARYSGSTYSIEFDGDGVWVRRHTEPSASGPAAEFGWCGQPGELFWRNLALVRRGDLSVDRYARHLLAGANTRLIS